MGILCQGLRALTVPILRGHLRPLNIYSLMLICVIVQFVLLFDKVSCHKLGEDVIAYFEAYLPSGNKCGQQKPITGWTVKYDRFRDDVSPGTAVDDTYFSSSTGIYTTPHAGVYHCCSAFRCKQGGVCDFAIIRFRNGNYFGAFGTRTSRNNDWSSHSLCVTSRCAKGVTWQVNMESTGGNDCIEETDWMYSRFSCYYTSPN